ncbi:MAG: OmpA family protein [Acidobacteriota bacterium]|nr:OmpA family protein [Acidobacteriota bacterium]
MRTKKRSLAVLVGILGVVLLAGACKKKTPAPTPPPPPPPAPPAPTVTLTAEPSTIDKGQSVTLSWSSQNATDLDLQPGVGKVQASGSSTVTPQDSTTYTLTATGPGGSQSATARVTVTIPPPPPPPPPPVKEISEDELFNQNVKDAFFDYDKANIRADAETVLTGDATFLKDHASIKFTIEGKCDDRGSEEYNLGLGDKRATAAKNFLVNAGVSADRISTISYGKSRPVEGCDQSGKSEDCWQQNRVDHFHYGAETK